MNWLLLRGLGREKRHWLNFPGQLCRPGDNVYFLDLPGFGDQKNINPPLTISAHTDFLRPQLHVFQQQFQQQLKPALKEQTEPTQPWAVIGISMGGMIALDWVHRFPTDFQNLIIINSSTSELSAFHQRFSPFAIYCTLRTLFAKNLYEREKSILKLISNLHQQNPDTIQSMVTIAESHVRSYTHLGRQIYAASRFECPKDVAVPTLVLASIKDRMVDVRCSKALAEKLHAQIKFHPTAGHDLALDDAAWAADRIHEFISASKA